MTAFLRTLGRQTRAYGGGILVAAIVVAFLERVLSPGAQGWPRVDLEHVSFAYLPNAIITTATGNFVGLLLPFSLLRAFVVMNAGVMSGRVGPVAAVVSGAVPAVVTTAWLTWLLGGVSTLNATSLLLTGLGGAVCGLGYWRLGGFPEWIRP